MATLEDGTETELTAIGNDGQIAVDNEISPTILYSTVPYPQV